MSEFVQRKRDIYVPKEFTDEKTLRENLAKAENVFMREYDFSGRTESSVDYLNFSTVKEVGDFYRIYMSSSTNTSSPDFIHDGDWVEALEASIGKNDYNDVYVASMYHSEYDEYESNPHLELNLKDKQLRKFQIPNNRETAWDFRKEIEKIYSIIKSGKNPTLDDLPEIKKKTGLVVARDDYSHVFKNNLLFYPPTLANTLEKYKDHEALKQAFASPLNAIIALAATSIFDLKKEQTAYKNDPYSGSYRDHSDVQFDLSTHAYFNENVSNIVFLDKNIEAVFARSFRTEKMLQNIDFLDKAGSINLINYTDKNGKECSLNLKIDANDGKYKLVLNGYDFEADKNMGTKEASFEDAKNAVRHFLKTKENSCDLYEHSTFDSYGTLAIRVRTLPLDRGNMFKDLENIANENILDYVKENVLKTSTPVQEANNLESDKIINNDKITYLNPYAEAKIIQGQADDFAKDYVMVVCTDKYNNAVVLEKNDGVKLLSLATIRYNDEKKREILPAREYNPFGSMVEELNSKYLNEKASPHFSKVFDKNAKNDNSLEIK